MTSNAGYLMRIEGDRIRALNTKYAETNEKYYSQELFRIALMNNRKNFSNYDILEINMLIHKGNT